METQSAHSAAGDLRSLAKTILVIHNDAAFRHDVCRILRQNGFSAVPARSGVEAPWFAEHPAADLLIMGLMLPERDEYHLGILYHRLEARMPVIFTAAMPRSQCVSRGLISDRAPYLHQPFPPGECARIVRRVLANWRPPKVA